MRTRQQIDDMLAISQAQERVSRARDYWQGVTDGLQFSLGAMPDALQARLMVDQATREHMRAWAAGEVTHRDEEDE